MAKVATKETPLMKQYNAIKRKHPGALLLFRVGDFYETFGEDAIKASKVLDIVLTKRANGAASHIELAGFPHHAMDTYLPKLVRAGHRVAICDQLEDPKMVKGLVKRGITELVTPGLSLNDNVLDQKKNNYLAAVHIQKETHGLSFLDLSTGEFSVTEGNQVYINKLIQGFQPAELLYSKAKKEWFQEHFEQNFSTYSLEEWVFSSDYAREKLQEHFKVNTLKGFGIDALQVGTVAAAVILYYLELTEHKQLAHISTIARIDEHKFVWLDQFTIRNLELIYPSQPDGMSLFDVLNKTITATGARQLRKWMVLPLKDKFEIEYRLTAVEEFVKEETVAQNLRIHLEGISDLERLVAKVATRRINPRELLLLKKSLSCINPIKEELLQYNTFPILAQQLNPFEAIIEKLNKCISDEPPLSVNLGNTIKTGVDDTLDELRTISNSGKGFLENIKKREVERTGITSLKIAFNKVFGYYLEVSNAHKDKVPSEWIRKQTLVNAERYITEELKEYEEKILNAESQIQVIEQRLYDDIVAETQLYTESIQQNARLIAELDCLLSFAFVAKENNYVKPKLSRDQQLEIKGGRHPVIEQTLPEGEDYISNDVFLDSDSLQIMIITGPNMAGKSALLRQTALITLMAQMGSYVPADYAQIGIVDKIFTRVGASDNLSKGESTFMVEMIETASILNNLSENSLVLMDEIGRGTSTYDGISIAWSIVEYLHNHPKWRAKTLFATHYHELNVLEKELARVSNFNVSVKQVENKIVFMRKLVKGGSQHSFGINVAEMAGIPNQVLIRSSEILHGLEKEKLSKKDIKKLEEIPSSNLQLSLFESDPYFDQLLKIVEDVDINSTSPMEALLKLNEIQQLIKSR